MPGLTEIFGMEASWHRCESCGLPFQVPTYIYDWACWNKKSIYCPYGHQNVVILRTDQTLDGKEQTINHLRTELRNTDRRLSAARGQITKLRKELGR